MPPVEIISNVQTDLVGKRIEVLSFHYEYEHYKEGYPVVEGLVRGVVTNGREVELFIEVDRDTNLPYILDRDRRKLAGRIVRITWETFIAIRVIEPEVAA